MADEHSVAFRSLAGIEPGVTTLGEVRKEFGEPEEVLRTEGLPSHVTGGSPGGDLVWVYETRGVTIFVYRDHAETQNPFIDEVRVPFDAELPIGLHLGQSLESARSVIASKFQITDEYEDAIYFKAGIACVR